MLMSIALRPTDAILLAGDFDLIAGAATCLLCAGHQLKVCTPDIAGFTSLLNSCLQGRGQESIAEGQLAVSAELQSQPNYRMAIGITHEDLAIKQGLLQQLASAVSRDAVICINTESIALSILQQGLENPVRIIGLNWAEPVHTTFFLEIISPGKDNEYAEELLRLARASWSKDPYIVNNNSIRSRLISAMAREAAYLVDNGYASVDDIDRACRNDAGYYLPFCGNGRYMDLMGTYAYGMVMKDLNPDLSTDSRLPAFMHRILVEGGQGMKNNKGFYNYTDEQTGNWKEVMDRFSYQIRSVMEKYPFNYNQETFED